MKRFEIMAVIFIGILSVTGIAFSAVKIAEAQTASGRPVDPKAIDKLNRITMTTLSS